MPPTPCPQSPGKTGLRWKGSPRAHSLSWGVSKEPPQLTALCPPLCCYKNPGRGLRAWGGPTHREPGPHPVPCAAQGPTPLEAEGPGSPGEGSQAADRGCRGAEVGQKPTSLPNSRGPCTCPQTPVGLTRLGPAHHNVSRGKPASSPSWEGWGSLTPGRRPAACSRPRRTHTGRRAARGSPGGFSRRRADPPLQERGRVSRAPRTGAAPQTHSRAGRILGWDKLGPTLAQTPATLQARAAP